MKLEPCPFCGVVPEDGELVWCENKSCHFYKRAPMFTEHWNRRAPSRPESRPEEKI